MKKSGILNAELCGNLARLGHTDTVVVADVGLPRPAGVPVVDLALVAGVPTFRQVLDALADELVVEEATVATESREKNHSVVEAVSAYFGTLRWVSHEELKLESAGAQLLVRTGEARPYANVILRCGVPF